jgi:hypothetical protein
MIFQIKIIKNYHVLKININIKFTFPVPGGPANRTARPAIFLALINSTITPAAFIKNKN